MKDFLLGFGCGASLMFGAAMWMVQRQLQRLVSPPPLARKLESPEPDRRVDQLLVEAEKQELQRIAIAQGATSLMQLAKQQGRILSQADAEAEAQRLWEVAGG